MSTELALSCGLQVRRGAVSLPCDHAPPSEPRQAALLDGEKPQQGILTPSRDDPPASATERLIDRVRRLLGRSCCRLMRLAGACLMDAMDCPNCDGTGYTEDATGEEILCPMCDGSGFLVTSHDASDDDRLP